VDILTKAEFTASRALALYKQSRLEEARQLCVQVLGVLPTHAQTLHLLGVISSRSNNPALAVELLGRAIISGPSAAVYVNHGNALQLLGRHDAAIESYDQAIALDRNEVLAHFNRANALRALTHHQDAVASYDKTIALDARNAEAYLYRGISLLQLEHYEEACASFDAVLAIGPAAEAYKLRGNALRQLELLSAAIASYDEAIALQPNDGETYNNRGVAESDARRYAPAVADFDRAISIEPRRAIYHYNRGNALQKLLRHAAAVASYDQAIALETDGVRGYYNRGNSLYALGQYEAAIASYDLALQSEADTRFIHGARLIARMQICDWNGLQGDIQQLLAAIERSEPASVPFPVLVSVDSTKWQQMAARSWARQHVPKHPLPAIAQRDRHDKIRVAYFSPDFRKHAVSVLAVELLESHDRSGFEIAAFSFSDAPPDELTLRLQPAFDHFVDVRDRSDQEIALIAREMEIDIAVDLAGFTERSRPGVFATRAAPVQVAYLGFPGTMGAEYMDYLMADRTVISHQDACNYDEKIIYLPNSYLPNDSTRTISSVTQQRQEFGLPPGSFVFCCFNRSYKITPSTFDSWMRILRQIDGSVLWLSRYSTKACSNLQRWAEQSGVDGERLVFSEQVASPSEHLARHRLADLFLDTLPYNAHATAMDALWAGLPLLTCIGEGFAGRVGASLLKAVNLPELITSSRQDYEELAVKLATDPGLLTAIRQRLKINRETTPLFDTRRLVRDIESGYRLIYERYRENSPPQDVYV
jgi:predicted O-linked N-acetylglucosamine transferase (SPINDLY family)